MNHSKELNIAKLIEEAQFFVTQESAHWEPSLFGISDGKAVGTHLDKRFQDYLSQKYTYTRGNAASGIDFPDLNVDIKTTSGKQPQSSCPFRDARQKIYGLGYSLLVFVYQKNDDQVNQTSNLDIKHAVFVESDRTADFQLTSQLLSILDNDGNKDDVLAAFSNSMLPLDDIKADLLADEVLNTPPKLGYLTISNALQWRLQYKRVIDKADAVEGIVRIK